MTANGAAAPEAVPAAARLDGDTLVVGNALLERRWRITAAGLVATSIRDLVADRDWAVRESALPSLVGRAVPPAPVEGIELATERRAWCGVGQEFLLATVTVRRADRTTTYRFAVPDRVAAVGMQLERPGLDEAVSVDDAAAGAGGVEAAAAGADGGDLAPDDVIDAFVLDRRHCRLGAVEFVGQTDHHANLVFTRSYSLHPSERRIGLRGNLWHLDHRPTGAGLVVVRTAPDPDARFPRVPLDLELSDDHLVTRGHGTGETGPWQWLAVHGDGAAGRTAVLHDLQLAWRRYLPGRDGTVVSNTWGDRSRDARMNEDFVLAEIAAAREVGIDVVQLDDGWQSGITANAWNRPQDGTWGEYWAIDPNFWTPRQPGFPRGLGPVAEACRAAGLGLGLWYSPDSSGEFSQWERDVEQLVQLASDHDVRQFKIDGVLLTSQPAQQRFLRLLDTVVERCDGTVSFDADVTAQVRLGYWGAPHLGPLFVENRYTDWANYWPHETLRALWQLSHHIHPARLRMEFLNPYRNVDRYGDDPLAPVRYRPATLFAMVMVASPLAWLELSNAPDSFRTEVAEIIAVWKEHRAALHDGPVLPIGAEPDGWSWSGFRTARRTGPIHAVVFRPLGDDAGWSFDTGRDDLTAVRWLSGPGRARINGGRVEVEVDEPLGYGFVELS